jgi:hypothetical protein
MSAMNSDRFTQIFMVCVALVFSTVDTAAVNCGRAPGYKVRRYATTTTALITVAGSATAGSIDTPNAAAATLNAPNCIKMDIYSGTMYVSDKANNKIRAIAKNGAVTTFAGTGTAGSVDSTNRLTAQFNAPAGMSIDYTSFALYIAAAGEHKIRRIYLKTGVVQTASGSGISGSFDSNMFGPTGRLSGPLGVVVAMDQSKLYIADTGNSNIRVADLTNNGWLSTLAFSWLGATFSAPEGITYNYNGVLYVTDTGNGRVVSVTTSSGTVTVIASSLAGVAGLEGDWDRNRLYVAQRSSNRIISVLISTGAVTAVAGSGTAGFADSATPTTGQLSAPNDVFFHAFDGALVVTDRTNNRIRGVRAVAPVCRNVTVSESKTHPSPSRDATMTDTQNVTASPSRDQTMTDSLSPSDSLTKDPTVSESLSDSAGTETDEGTLTSSDTPSPSRTASLTFPSQSISVAVTTTLSRSISSTLTADDTASRSSTLSISETYDGTNTESVIITNSLTRDLTATKTASRGTSSQTASATMTGTQTAPSPTISLPLTFTASLSQSTSQNATGSETPMNTASRSLSMSMSASVTGTATTMLSMTNTLAVSASTTADLTASETTSPTFTVTDSVSASMSKTSTVTLSPSQSSSLTPTVTPPPTPSASVSMSFSQSSSFSPTISPSVSASVTTSMSQSISQSRTMTQPPSSSISLTTTFQQTATASLSASRTGTLSAISSATTSFTQAHTWSVSSTLTPPPTQSISLSATAERSNSVSASLTGTLPLTKSATFTRPTPTTSVSISVSESPSPSRSLSATHSMSLPLTVTWSLSATPTATRTATLLATPSASLSLTNSASDTATPIFTVSVSVAASSSLTASHNTPSSTRSLTATSSVELPPTATVSRTITPPPTPTKTSSPTNSVTRTPPPTLTETSSHSLGCTRTPPRTLTMSHSRSGVVTPSRTTNESLTFSDSATEGSASSTRSKTQVQATFADRAAVARQLDPECSDVVMVAPRKQPLGYVIVAASLFMAVVYAIGFGLYCVLEWRRATNWEEQTARQAVAATYNAHRDAGWLFGFGAFASVSFDTMMAWLGETATAACVAELLDSCLARDRFLWTTRSDGTDAMAELDIDLSGSRTDAIVPALVSALTVCKNPTQHNSGQEVTPASWTALLRSYGVAWEDFTSVSAPAAMEKSARVARSVHEQSMFMMSCGSVLLPKTPTFRRQTLPQLANRRGSELMPTNDVTLSQLKSFDFQFDDRMMLSADTVNGGDQNASASLRHCLSTTQRRTSELATSTRFVRFDPASRPSISAIESYAKSDADTTICVLRGGQSLRCASISERRGRDLIPAVMEPATISMLDASIDSNSGLESEGKYSPPSLCLPRFVAQNKLAVSAMSPPRSVPAEKSLASRPSAMSTKQTTRQDRVPIPRVVTQRSTRAAAVAIAIACLSTLQVTAIYLEVLKSVPSPYVRSLQWLYGALSLMFLRHVGDGSEFAGIGWLFAIAIVLLLAVAFILFNDETIFRLNLEMYRHHRDKQYTPEAVGGTEAKRQCDDEELSDFPPLGVLLLPAVQRSVAQLLHDSPSAESAVLDSKSTCKLIKVGRGTLIFTRVDSAAENELDKSEKNAASAVDPHTTTAADEGLSPLGFTQTAYDPRMVASIEEPRPPLASDFELSPMFEEPCFEETDTVHDSFVHDSTLQDAKAPVARHPRLAVTSTRSLIAPVSLTAMSQLQLPSDEINFSQLASITNLQTPLNAQRNNLAGGVGLNPSLFVPRRTNPRSPMAAMAAGMRLQLGATDTLTANASLTSQIAKALRGDDYRNEALERCSDSPTASSPLARRVADLLPRGDLMGSRTSMPPTPATLRSTMMGQRARTSWANCMEGAEEGPAKALPQLLPVPDFSSSKAGPITQYLHQTTSRSGGSAPPLATSPALSSDADASTVVIESEAFASAISSCGDEEANGSESCTAVSSPLRPSQISIYNSSGDVTPASPADLIALDHFELDKTTPELSVAVSLQDVTLPNNLSLQQHPPPTKFITKKYSCLDHCCAIHRRVPLAGIEQNAVFPYTQSRQCSVIIDGERCGRSVGALYVCTHRGEAGSEDCGYALCSQHFAPTTWQQRLSARMLTMQRDARRLRQQWRHTLALVVMYAAAIAYVPVLTVCYLVLSCNPRYRCGVLVQGEKCWEKPSALFYGTAMVAILIVIVYGFVFPLIVVSRLYRRQMLLRQVFLGLEYGNAFLFALDAPDTAARSVHSSVAGKMRSRVLGCIRCRRGSNAGRSARLDLAARTAKYMSIEHVLEIAATPQATTAVLKPETIVDPREYERFAASDTTVLHTVFGAAYSFEAFPRAVALAFARVLLLAAPTTVNAGGIGQPAAMAAGEVVFFVLAALLDAPLSGWHLAAVALSSVHQFAFIGLYAVHQMTTRDRDRVAAVMVNVTFLYMLLTVGLAFIAACESTIVDALHERRVKAMFARFRNLVLRVDEGQLYTEDTNT